MSHRIQIAKARKDFANVVGRSSRGERIKVTRYGHTLAAIIPKADLEKLEDCEKDEPARQSAPPARRRHDG
jgi:prevent-host-death family protein